MREAFLARTDGGNTLIWPLHVPWASLQHGGVRGLTIMVFLGLKGFLGHVTFSAKTEEDPRKPG